MFQHVERILSRIGATHGPAGTLQHALGDLPYQHVILNQQDATRHGRGLHGHWGRRDLTAWQPDFEPRAATLTAFDRQETAALPRDVMDRGGAETGTTTRAPGGDTGLENVGQKIAWNTDAGVHHGDHGIVAGRNAVRNAVLLDVNRLP